MTESINELYEMSTCPVNQFMQLLNNSELCFPSKNRSDFRFKYLNCFIPILSQKFIRFDAEKSATRKTFTLICISKILSFGAGNFQRYSVEISNLSKTTATCHFRINSITKKNIYVWTVHTTHILLTENKTEFSSFAYVNLHCVGILDRIQKEIFVREILLKFYIR